MRWLRFNEKRHEPTLILRTSTLLLAIAAVGGLVMAGIRFAGDRQPPGLPGMAIGALVLFLVAAGGGVILNLNYHWKQLPLPKWLVTVHAVAAVVGFLMLLTVTWGTRNA